MNLKTKYQALFLVFVCLLLYYHSINNPVNSIDDYKMFNWLLNLHSINLKHLFFPHSGGYYRPCCILTYEIDRFLWLLNESFYHLENIIIHTINAVFVFFVAQRLFGKKYKYIPLFCALLFAAHPVNTEAVNWISARCDLLATFFSLSAFLIFLQFKDRQYWILGALFSASMAFLGALSKEVGVAFYPAIIMWILFFERDEFKKKSIEIIVFTLFIVLYFYWRHLALMHSDSSFHRISAAAIHHNYFKDIFIIIQAFGFYVKKLFDPFPLNFGILHVSKSYFYLGLFAAIFSGFSLYLRNKFFGLFLISLWFIAPATLVALGNVAWTNYAERYIYTASAFFSIFAVAELFELLKNKEKIYVGFMILAISFCFVASYKRNLVWSSNLSLYKDTSEKSPDFVIARNEYANALLLAGKRKEAEKQYTLAAKIKDRTNVLPELNSIITTDNISAQKKKEKLLALLGKLPRLNNDILNRIIKLNFKIIEENPKEKNKLYLENADIFHELFRHTGNGFYLYKEAQMYIAVKNYQKAKECLIEAKKHLDKNNLYHKMSNKLLQKIESLSVSRKDSAENISLYTKG